MDQNLFSDHIQGYIFAKWIGKLNWKIDLLHSTRISLKFIYGNKPKCLKSKIKLLLKTFGSYKCKITFDMKIPSSFCCIEWYLHMICARTLIEPDQGHLPPPPEMMLGGPPFCQIFQNTDGFKMPYIMHDVIICSNYCSLLQQQQQHFSRLILLYFYICSLCHIKRQL